MLLRRVISHVRQQEWTAIGIDLVIVVVGVFIGIQVANWNTTEIEKRETREALQRLEIDLRLSVTQTQYGIEFITENARYSDLVFDRLAACELSEGGRDAFATGLYRLGKVVSAQFVRTTFDELRDSGRLGLIENLELRQALNEVVRSQESQEFWLRMQAARIEPHIEPVVITNRPAVIVGNAFLRSASALDDFAAKDGFASWEEMKQFFCPHGRAFDGNMYGWVLTPWPSTTSRRALHGY